MERTTKLTSYMCMSQVFATAVRKTIYSAVVISGSVAVFIVQGSEDNISYTYSSGKHPKFVVMGSTAKDIIACNYVKNGPCALPLTMGEVRIMPTKLIWIVVQKGKIEPFSLLTSNFH